MRIVVNEQLKDEIEWTCKYANEYKVDIDIHIDADGEISVSVCPTYRDTADTPQTEETCERCVYVRGSQWCQGCNGIPKRWDGEKIADTPQTDTHEKAVEALAYLIGQKKPSYSSGSNSYGEQVQTDKTDCDKCIWSVCNYNKVDWEADTPQTEICDTCKYRSSNVFGNWCVGRDTCDRYEADTPQPKSTGSPIGDYRDGVGAWQTDCSWREPND